MSKVLCIGKEVLRSLPPEYGNYRVSNWGFVYSGRSGRLLAQRTKPCGHLDVNLSCHGKLNRRLVHRLVLLAFSGPCPAGQEGLHTNGKPGDNRLCNLRWGTRSENHLDRTRHGGTNIRGRNNPNYKHGRNVGRNRREYMRAWYAAKRGYAIG